MAKTATSQDQERARTILYDVWAAKNRRTLKADEFAWLRQFSSVPEETAIDIAMRIIGMEWNWREVDGFDERAIVLRRRLGYKDGGEGGEFESE